MGRGKDDPHLRSVLREQGEQLPLIAFDFALVKATSADGETEQKYATTLVAVDADLFLVKAIPMLGKETTDYSATALIKFIEVFFHKHVRLRCDGDPSTVAIANEVKHMAGDLVQLETTPKYSSASNPAERAIQAVEEQVRTIRADCQMRFGSGEAFGADKPIWAWLLRHAGWKISRYKQKGNGMTAYKQAYGEHYTHEFVPFAEIVLVRVPRPTHRGLAGGKRWHKGDAVFIKGVWVGRTQTSDEHVATHNSTTGTVTTTRCCISQLCERSTMGRRRRYFPRSTKKGTCTTTTNFCWRENNQTHNPDMPDNAADNHSQSPKETDDTNETDNVPMSETPSDDGRDASHIKSKSSLDDTSGVRQRLKFDGVATGMTPDPKRANETVKHGEIRESNALPGESPDKKKVRFLSEPGDGGACAITVEELVEDYWSDEHGQGAMYEGLHCKVEPDLDTTATKAALDRLLQNGVVLEIPRDEGVGMKHVTSRWEKTWRKRNNEWEYKVRSVGREYKWEEFRDDLFAPGASYCTGRVVDILSLKRRVPTFTLGCTDAFHQAPEPDDVVVEPPEEYLNRLRAAGRSTNIWWNCKSNCRVVDKRVNVG